MLAPFDLELKKVVLLIVLILLALPSCDDFPAQDALGVSVDAGGKIQVLFFLCPDEALRRVALVEQRGPAIDDGDDPLVWEIFSEEGEAVSSVTVGEEPPGFTTSHSLSRTLSTTELLGVILESTKVDVITNFHIEDLQEGKIFTVGEETITPETFHSRGQKTCP